LNLAVGGLICEEWKVRNTKCDFFPHIRLLATGKCPAIQYEWFRWLFIEQCSGMHSTKHAAISGVKVFIASQKHAATPAVNAWFALATNR
jgi:hypothetical protein